MTDEPLDHIERVSVPWRTDGKLTECGRPLADVASVITREAMAAKVKAQGQARAAFTTCMTCAQTSDRWSPRQAIPTSWATDPIAVLRRECERYGFWTDGEKAEPFRRELLAIEALVDAHRGEFDEMVQGLGEVSDLRQVRREKRKTR